MVTMQPSRPLLRVENVDQIYRTGFWLRPSQVLHGVSLEVPRKTVFGFLGANGAGKTTLIQLIVGLRRPTAGRVTIDGLDAHTPQARARIGYLPERPYFYDHLTGQQFLHYFGALSGMKRAEVEKKMPEVLDTVGMGHARKLELKRYSKGMLQRIGIAQAILHDPEFLILDEPMSGLDPLGRKEIRELIIALARQGKTVFFSSHVIPDVEAVCDQVALIQKGRLIGRGKIDALVPAQASRTEIRFSDIGIPEFAGLAGLESARETGDGSFSAILDGSTDVNSVLAGLLQLRAKIQAVIPQRPSLEDLFEESK